VVDVDGDRGIFENGAVVEEDVVVQAVRSADADVDAVVGGAEVVARLSGGSAGEKQRRNATSSVTWNLFVRERLRKGMSVSSWR